MRDADGRFLYLRDEESGDFWSLAWQTTQPEYEHFECRHRQGSTEFVTRLAGLEARWRLLVAPDAPLEIWLVTLRNLGLRPRRLSLFSYLEWLLGAAPDWDREFHKTFIETSFEREGSVILATKCNWEPPIPESSHWNIDWPHVAFHSASVGVDGFETDKQAFLGQYGSPANPRALRRASLQGTTGRWGDAIASIQVTLDLAPDTEEMAVFVLGAAEDLAQALDLAKRFTQPAVAEAALAQTHANWQERTSRLQVESPDPALNLMTNNWLIYQTISCQLWARSAYYQTGGAFGFRDQLQDSLSFLLLGQAELTLAQFRLHARHQFVDGGVHHWWHHLRALGSEKETESGFRTKISDK